MNVNYGDFKITDEETTVQRVFELLYNESSSSGLTKEAVEEAISNSLCVSIYDDAKLIAFARTVTDYSTLSVILDVVVDPDYRGKGLGKALFNFFQRHPKLQGTAKILWTKGGDKFFESMGYKKVNRTLLIKR